MCTIIFQSDARAADPIGSCYRIIRELEQRISMAKAELEIVLHHLALCRAAAAGDSTLQYVDDMNSWGNYQECNDDDVRPILDHLAYDDDVREEDQFKFDSNGNIVSSNNAVLT